MNESFALSSSATEFASLPPENVSLVPINPTVVSGHLDQVWAMDYACTQVPPEFDFAFLSLTYRRLAGTVKTERLYCNSSPQKQEGSRA